MPSWRASAVSRTAVIAQSAVNSSRVPRAASARTVRSLRPYPSPARPPQALPEPADAPAQNRGPLAQHGGRRGPATSVLAPPTGRSRVLGVRVPRAFAPDALQIDERDAEYGARDRVEHHADVRRL